MPEINTVRRGGASYTTPVTLALNTKIEEGHAVAINSDGLAVPMAVAVGNKFAGRCETTSDSTGSDEPVRMAVRRGCEFRWANATAADAVTQSDVGNKAYFVDSHTVSADSDTNTRPEAGQIIAVEAAGVFVMAQ